MAYKASFNPDALPAHAEPDQAAQMIASTHQQQPPQRQQTTPAQGRPDYNKPAPPIPSQSNQKQHPHQEYRRPSNPPSTQSPVYSNNSGYGGGYGGGYGPPQGGGGGPQGGGGGGGGGGAQNYQGYGGPPRASTSPRPPGSFPPNNNSNSGGYGPRHDSMPTSSPGPGGPHPQRSPRQQSAMPAPLKVSSRTSPGPGSSTQGPFHAPQPGPAPGPVPSPQIPPAGDSSLFSLFRAVDDKGTGQLGELQLGKALRNGDYTSFDPQTVRLMIRMFDHDRSGTVGFEEFQGLWGFLGAWRGLFERFDEDKSGHISYEEFGKALLAFGYHLSPEFVRTIYSLHDRPGPNRMSFDLFVQSCISLKRMTDVFKKYDTDRDGYVTMSFEEFLTEILNQRT